MTFDLFTLLFCGVATVTTGANLILHINDQTNHRKGLVLFATFTMAWGALSLSLINYNKTANHSACSEQTGTK